MMRLKLGPYREVEYGTKVADIINTESGGIGGHLHRVETFAGVRYMGFKNGKAKSCNSTGKPSRYESYFKERRQAISAVMTSYGVPPQDWFLA